MHRVLLTALSALALVLTGDATALGAIETDHATTSDRAAQADDSDLLDGLDSVAFARAEVPAGEALIGTWYLDIEKPDTFGDWGVHLVHHTPLAEPPTSMEYVPNGTTTTDCTGTSEEPTAAAGTLCIYERIRSAGLSYSTLSAGLQNIQTAGRYGASFLFAHSDGDAGNGFAYGTYAVHVPESGPRRPVVEDTTTDDG